ncbi:Aste57867_2238 [Aphanomyces stellatus]|uniref:Aste57867_2238 protein n=1 Tax=Aphanomyces stellatus TaxID=120398 RepID=A0A485KBF7_9STRA|nr:hypothetical protein As57867_002233 [Aphanomyces stellatus]VFT79441.1 Aste57867_2238 [Aphanomyces stellatus]
MDAYQQQQMQEQERRRQQVAAAQMAGTFGTNMAMFAQPGAMMHPQQMHYPMHIQPGMMYPDDVSQYLPNGGGGGATHMPMAAPLNATTYGYFGQPPGAGTPYDAEGTGSSLAAGKRHAATGRWKPPPQPMYPKSKPTAETSNAAPPPPSDAVTADSFAAGTQGLVLDKALLSKLLVRDESEISDEQIRSIMLNKEMLSIYKTLQQEEIKRQKRLDNNRKTAQMRRKKKKGLVETYEAQVSELETILAKIHAHKFGQGDVQTLVDALSGEQRQSVHMTKDTKHQETSVLLKQHSRNASAIRQANEDSWMVTLAATGDPAFVDLKHKLGLTDMQCMRLQQLQSHVHNESTRLAIVEKCFAALHVHAWLHFPHTETLVDLFRAPLNDAQLQKFVQWTRVNQHVIQQLQFAVAADPKEKDMLFEFPSEL